MFNEALKYLKLKEKAWFLLGSMAFYLYNLLPKHIFETRNFIEKAIHYKYNIKNLKKTIELSDTDENKYILRKRSSDLKVFNQIILDEEFKNIKDLIIKNGISVTSILDAGSNIGLTTIYFKKYFPEAKIICVEPDENNLLQLKANIVINELKDITIIEGGIWINKGFLKIDTTFRDGMEWSRRLLPSADQSGTVPTFTIDELLYSNNWDFVDFLKIDIEGAEEYIFTDIANLEFLRKVKVISVEVHRVFEIGHIIVDVFLKYGFKIYISGELLIGIRG